MNGAGENIVLMTVLPITIVFWAWVVWVILEWRKMRNKSKLQSKIVDKFSTAQELSDFLQSKEGSRFLNFLRFNGRAPRDKILSSLSKGIILSFLGIAVIVVGSLFSEEMRYFIAFGIVLIAIGVGFLLSTFISYKLSKKWGIINEGS
ncbi:MAG: hypothetical protein GTO17_04395 [Candidatus Aminicenantes bacterium]|nr:hypothetical protein [Candidatus Aminicenantes bacterium]